ncbi:pantetheinase-like [Watersipora subatra]|uniref:pantetheinase-like n=1 Tax=Watersipora subatra TaxID=2589382 RepID=UPI00355BC73F
MDKQMFIEGRKFEKHKQDDRRCLKLLAAFAIIVFSVVGSVVQIQMFWLTTGEKVSVRAPSVKSFRVGVFEKKLVSVKNAKTRKEAMVAIHENLAHIERQAKIAHEQGVSFLVLPEYGITGEMPEHFNERSSLYPYMEQVPAVSMSHPACINCKWMHHGVEGQASIGCMALKYDMYILANLVESVPCDIKLDSLCPSDHHYQYSTNIVYDPQGCLVAKYRKYYLIGEESAKFDRPSEPMHVYFDTNYGRFGTMTSMDALFAEPGIGLVEKFAIDHLLLPIYWKSISVYQQAVNWQIAFSTKNNINLIAANVYNPARNIFGSSILCGPRVVNITSQTNSSSGILLTGDLPSNKPLARQQAVSLKDCSIDTSSNNLMTETVIIDGDIFDAIVLQGLNGTAKVCQNTTCCQVKYTRNATKDTYIVSAFQGMHSSLPQLASEICLVSKCQNETLSSCGNNEVTTSTTFSHLTLSASISVQHIYPIVLPFDNDYKSHLNWTFRQCAPKNAVVSSSKWPVVALGMVGRDFAKDSFI